MSVLGNLFEVSDEWVSNGWRLQASAEFFFWLLPPLVRGITELEPTKWLYISDCEKKSWGSSRLPLTNNTDNYRKKSAILWLYLPPFLRLKIHGKVGPGKVRKRWRYDLSAWGKFYPLGERLIFCPTKIQPPRVRSRWRKGLSLVAILPSLAFPSLFLSFFFSLFLSLSLALRAPFSLFFTQILD